MKSTQITAMILTKDEAHRLPLIFKNLEDFAEIIVFDGGSTDDTEKVCNQYGVQFIQRPIEFRPVAGADGKFALSKIVTPYVLFVNCAHYYPKRLLNEFKRVAEEGKYHAVYHDYVVYSYMRVVHRPFFRRRSSATNFYRVDAVNFLNSVVHNEAPVELPEHLKWRLPATDEYSVHLFRDYNVKKTESNHSFYADLDASQRFEMGFRTNLFMILWKPCKYFLYQYIRCGSILFGLEGFIYSVLYAQLELNIQIKIWELQNNFSLKFISDSHLKMREKFYHEKY